MRTYFRYILIALLSCAVSCTTNDEMADLNGEGKMSLRLVSSAMTRASDEQHNEDFLDKVDIYLFGSTTEASKWHTTLDTNANGSITLNGENEIYIPASALNSVGNSPKLYVIANYDNTTSPLPESATLAELQKQVVAKASWGPTAETEAWKAQSSFVMEGLGDVTKNGNQLSGTVNLKRAAAKIDLSITDIVDQVVSGDYVWKPVVSAANALNVTLKNAVTTSYVGADWDKTYEYFGTNGSTINYTFTAGTSSTVDGATITPYSQTYPFYSYSSDQAKGANEAYMVLVVPWQMYDKQNNAVGDVENLYYEVPIGGRDNKRIERNNHYKVSIYVGTLGSKSKDENVTLEPEITVVDWSTGQIAVDIKEAKYLVVDETVVNIYNQNENFVKYSSSHHPVTVEIVSVTKPDYSGTNATIHTYTPSSADKTTVTPTQVNGRGNTNQFKIEVDDGQIKLSHTLVNDNTSAMFDYVPYTITVNVTNSAGLTQQITYKQYPAVYVENKLNSSQTTRDTWHSSTDSEDGTNGYKNSGYGYVMVNTLYDKRYDYSKSYSNGYNKWQTIESFDSSSNNPNMYIITTTALDSSLADKYILADSREEATYTDDQIGFTAVEDVNKKQLEKYRPARTDRDDYLSPKFRISSAYGQLGSHTLSADEAKKRCAAYQEDGYPAGRWRLATYAELEFIAILCGKGALPMSLFGASSYWCATGPLSINTANGSVSMGSGSSGYLRCVYDDWYWGQEQLTDKTKYMWGDESTTAELNATLK